MKKVFKLSHDLARQGVKKFADLCEAGWTVTFAPPVKSREQEEKYHAMIGDISKQYGGELADKEDAKRILISAFRHDTRELLKDEWEKFGDLRMGRGLRGEVVLLGTQSRRFSKVLASNFIEWLYAFGAENDIAWTPNGFHEDRKAA